MAKDPYEGKCWACAQTMEAEDCGEGKPPAGLCDACTETAEGYRDQDYKPAGVQRMLDMIDLNS